MRRRILVALVVLVGIILVVPRGWRIEERVEGMGSTHFVFIDPDGTEAPVDVMGQGVGNG